MTVPNGNNSLKTLVRQTGRRNLLNTRKKKGVLFRTTEGLKRSNENRLPEEKNIAFTEVNINNQSALKKNIGNYILQNPNTPYDFIQTALVNNKMAAKEARGARNFFINHPNYYSSTAENVARRNAKAKATAKRRQFRNNKSMRYYTERRRAYGKSENMARATALQLARNVAAGRINNTEVPERNN